MGWNRIYDEARPSPLRAEPATFTAAATDATNAAQTAREVARRFNQLTSGLDAPVEGEAGRALGTMVEVVEQEVSALAPVFEDLAEILDDHARHLETYHQNAADGLARAWQAHNELRAAIAARSDGGAAVDHAQGQVTSAQGNVSWLRNQIDELEVMPEAALSVAELQSRLDWWEDELGERRGALDHARSRLADAEHRVDEAEGERRRWFEDSGRWRSYANMREAEDRLNEHTAARIRALDLGVLSDPSVLEQLEQRFRDFGEWITDLPDAVSDWIRENGPLLHRIRQVMQTISGILGTISLVLTFIPGLQGVAAAFRLASFAFAAAAFLFTVALTWTGAKDAQGNTISWKSAVVEGVLLGVAAFGVKGDLAQVRGMETGIKAMQGNGGAAAFFRQQRASDLRRGYGTYINRQFWGSRRPLQTQLKTKWGTANDIYERTFGAEKPIDHLFGGVNIKKDGGNWLMDRVEERWDRARAAPCQASAADLIRAQSGVATQRPGAASFNQAFIGGLGAAA